MIASLLTAATVNLTRLAPRIDSRAPIALVQRRLERFFTDVRLNQAEVARLMVAALSLATHMTDPATLSTLIAILVMTASVACKTSL